MLADPNVIPSKGQEGSAWRERQKKIASSDRNALMAALVQILPSSTTSAPSVQPFKTVRVPKWLERSKDTPLFNHQMKLLNEAWKCDINPLYELGVAHDQRSAMRWIVRTITEGATYEATSPNRLGIGLVLRCLGDMIREAAERNEESRPKVMQNVLHTFALLHQINALPPNLYQQSPSTPDATIRSPPTLHLLSSRILASMSDAVWKVHQNRVAQTAGGTPNRMTHRGLRPPVKITAVDLPPEVWMEFVLWACVKGDYPIDGAMIIDRLVRKDVNKSSWLTSWSTCSSQELIRATVPAHQGIDGQRSAPGLPKTISAEVVKALIDDLVEELASSASQRGVLQPSHLLFRILLLKHLLVKDGGRLEIDWWHGIISRLIGAVVPNVDSRDQGPALGRLMQLASESRLTNQDLFAEDGLRNVVPASVQILSTILDHVYWKMTLAAEAGNYTATMRQLDSVRYITIKKKLKEAMPVGADLGEETGDTNGDDWSEVARSSHPSSQTWIRNRAAAAYLDLMIQTDQKAVDDDWIFSGNKPGARAPGDSDMAPELIPMMLRYAGFIKDEDLMARLESHMPVQSELSSPTNNEIIRASLEGHVYLSNWDRVAELMEIVKGSGHASWDARLAMALAKMILVWREASVQVGLDLVPNIQGASVLLKKMLDGEYGPPETERLPSTNEQDRYREAVRQMISQASEHLHWLSHDSQQDSSDLRECHKIPVVAFHILLSGVIRRHGCLAGKELWDMWCEEPSFAPSIDSADSKSHVDPTINIKSPWIRRTEHLIAEERESKTTEVITPTKEPVPSEESSNPLSSPSSPSTPSITIPLVKPSLATARMIGVAAESAYRWILTRKRPGPDGIFHPLKNQTDDLVQEEARAQMKLQLVAILKWAMRKYRALGLTNKDDEIRLTQGLLKEGAASRLAEHRAWKSDRARVYVRPPGRNQKSVEKRASAA